MLPHEAIGFGRHKAKARVIVRMTEDHDKAVRGVATGYEPGGHELRANADTLIRRQDAHWRQTQGIEAGAIRPDRHRAKGDMTDDPTVLLCHQRQRQRTGTPQGMHQIRFVCLAKSKAVDPVDRRLICWPLGPDSKHRLGTVIGYVKVHQRRLRLAAVAVTVQQIALTVGP
jgi:hypothetical protein